MKLTSRHAALSLLLTLSTLSVEAFGATPLPKVRQDPERMTVTGSRITLAPVTASDMPGRFLPAAHVGSAGAASPTEVNESNKAKAIAKKGSTFWGNVVSLMKNADIKAFIADLMGSELNITRASRTRTTHGDTIQETVTCTEIALGSGGKDACARIMIGPGPNGTKMVEVTQLIISGGKLVYSSADTMTFYVNSIEDLYGKMNEIDPEISL